MVAPLESNTVVFSNGTPKGLIDSTHTGGQVAPTSTVGLNDEWKNDQKKAKKRQTSLIINSNIPNRNPFSTLSVCFPWKVASRLTSRHHWHIVNRTTNIPKYTMRVSYLCITPVNPANMNRPPEAPVIGQGLTSTIWNGWLFSISFAFILFLFWWCLFLRSTSLVLNFGTVWGVNVDRLFTFLVFEYF